MIGGVIIFGVACLIGLWWISAAYERADAEFQDRRSAKAAAYRMAYEDMVAEEKRIFEETGKRQTLSTGPFYVEHLRRMGRDERGHRMKEAA